MRIELSTGELEVIAVAIENITITGKDAPVVGSLLTRITKSLQKAITKDGIPENGVPGNPPENIPLPITPVKQVSEGT